MAAPPVEVEVLDVGVDVVDCESGLETLLAGMAIILLEPVTREPAIVLVSEAAAMIEFA